MTADRSGRFLDAFTRIEKRLRAETDLPRTESFHSLVRKAAEQNQFVRRVKDDLREFADLRNAIVHERRGGDPIAEPHEETVGELRRIADTLDEPAKIDSLSRGSVIRCSPEEPVGQAARLMFQNDFSQLPVYADSEWRGLLTAETITRWLGAGLEDGMGIIEESPVGEILPYREPESEERFVSRGSSILAAIELFESVARDGKTLDAVIVTQNGRDTEEPLMILTAFDLPELYRAGGIVA